MKISIIVPVYNSARYITECIESLLQQTYKNYEILLVDDCSTDESLQICKDRAKSNPSISIIHLKKNGGVSIARNIGVRYAKGEYITFVDSDDYVANDFIEKLLSPLSTMNYDMILSGAIYFRGDGEVYHKETLRTRKWLMNEKYWLDFIQQPLITSPWAKLYKRKIIQEEGLIFDEALSLGEDRDFNIEYSQKIRSAYSMEYSGYFYRYGDGYSLTNKIHKDKFKNDLIYWSKIHKILGDVGLEYQEHRLFYIIVDNFLLSKKRYGIVHAWVELKKVEYLIDKIFLKTNLKKVIAPIWMKVFIHVLL